MARGPRNASALHMLVAMAVLVVPTVAITAVFTRNPAPAVSVVEPAPVASDAARSASFPVLVATSLPEGWVCTRARWTPAGATALDGKPAPGDLWQLGYLTPAQRYIGLDSRVVAPESFVRDRTRDGRADGQSVVAGASWQRYVSSDGRTRSLVQRADAVTVVSGDLPYEALEAFVGTLAVVPGPTR